MAAAKRKPAAKKPAAKKPAAKKCGAASNMRRDRASPVPTQVARQEARGEEEPQEVACGVRTRFLCYSHDAFTSRPAPKKATPKKSPKPAAKSPKAAKPAAKSPKAAKPAAKKCAGGVETAPSPRVDVSLAQVAREAGFEGQVAGQEEEPRQETGLEGEESCEEEDGRQEVPGEAIHAQQEEVVVPCLAVENPPPPRRIP